MPETKKIKAFNSLSSEDKANLFKLHLAFQFIKRANLTIEQKDIILDGIVATTPEAYDKGNSEKTVQARRDSVLLEFRAKSTFSVREGFEIFASLNGDENDIQLLKQYQTVTSAKYQVERRDSFRQLSNDGKSNTMKVHLALQMANRTFNKSQCEFIAEVLTLFSSEIYSYKKGTVEWNQINISLNSIKDRSLNFFQKEIAVEVFASLGGKTGSPENTENLAPNCSCSGSSDYCGWWRNGASCGGGSCRMQLGGCGTGLYYDCDGMCTGGAV